LHDLFPVIERISINAVRCDIEGIATFEEPETPHRVPYNA
jgi:hypothetical protein